MQACRMRKKIASQMVARFKLPKHPCLPFNRYFLCGTPAVPAGTAAQPTLGGGPVTSACQGQRVVVYPLLVKLQKCYKISPMPVLLTAAKAPEVALGVCHSCKAETT